MPLVTKDVRRLYHRVRRLMHPVLDSVFPVNYTPEEIQQQKKRLDPGRARNCGKANEVTNIRILKLTSALGIDQESSHSFIDEAYRVRLLPDHPTDGIKLASPMSDEDRYVHP